MFQIILINYTYARGTLFCSLPQEVDENFVVYHRRLMKILWKWVKATPARQCSDSVFYFLKMLKSRLTLIWVGFLGVCFKVVGEREVKLPTV